MADPDIPTEALEGSVSPRDELRARIMAKLLPVLREGPSVADAYADAGMELFYQVEDEWTQVKTTTVGAAGETWVDQRWLVARAVVQSVPGARVAADRTVEA